MAKGFVAEIAEVPDAPDVADIDVDGRGANRSFPKGFGLGGYLPSNPVGVSDRYPDVMEYPVGVPTGS